MDLIKKEIFKNIIFLFLFYLSKKNKIKLLIKSFKKKNTITKKLKKINRINFFEIYVNVNRKIRINLIIRFPFNKNHHI